MKYLDEYRDPALAAHWSEEIKGITTGSWTIMEVCGGQTHAILRNGIDHILPEKISLLHGPGCPVCVTPQEKIDLAVTLARREEVIFCSFGDMLRVPGTEGDLQAARASGADVRTVYSPLDCLKIARDNPEREIVFFAIGFETTAPANAALVYQARQQKLGNLSILVAQVLIPPAMEAILKSSPGRVQAFLAPGHVCSVTGCDEYKALSRQYGVPIVVTGFEPVDILQGIHMAVAQLEEGRAETENQYARAVKPEGSREGKRLIESVFEVIDRTWRGMGVIPASGLGLKPEYAAFDAEKKFNVTAHADSDSPECISGSILQGIKKPSDCAAFGKRCTPENPLGATMVSSEGACAAYYHYAGQRELQQQAVGRSSDER